MDRSTPKPPLTRFPGHGNRKDDRGYFEHNNPTSRVQRGQQGPGLGPDHSLGASHAQWSDPITRFHFPLTKNSKPKRGTLEEAKTAPGQWYRNLSNTRGVIFPVFWRTHKADYNNFQEERYPTICLQIPKLSQGLLLACVRDQINMTINSYKKLYESSIAFGIRKSIQCDRYKTDMGGRIKGFFFGKIRGQTWMRSAMSFRKRSMTWEISWRS